MTDAGHHLPDPPRHEFVMPVVTDIQTQAHKAEARQLSNFKSALPEDGADTFAVVVKTDQPIPVRAMGPVLYVGGTALTEVTEIAPNTYRFVAHRPLDLKPGAPMHLGWPGQPPASGQVSRFQFKP